ncbi:MAG: endonuclease III domain-containing protein [Gammaproteobacteria bacterium]|nr:endonuclease III domain-containing protein [Gammaproteobacteria bacterium]
MTPIQVYEHLYDYYGPQGWWPANSPFEVMLGAILTQNTAWINVEKAINNLKGGNALSPDSIINTSHEQLAEWIRPSGYFNIKSERLQNFCRWYLDHGKFEALNKLDTVSLRHRLLEINGVGPETADDMLLYAFERPIFVIDAYTRRLFSRLQLISGEEGYESARQYFEHNLSKHEGKVTLFNEYHALIVVHAKDHCRKRPICNKCPVYDECKYVTKMNRGLA